MNNPKGLKIIGRRGDWLSNMIEDKKWDSIKFKCGMIYTDMCVLSIKRLFLDAQDALVLLTLLLLENGTDKYNISVIYEIDKTIMNIDII